MRKKILRKILNTIDVEINVLNIEYIGNDLLNNSDYENIITELYILRNKILDLLCD